MKKIHNSFRNNWSWYRQWHNFKYSTHIHFILLFGLIFAISGIYVLKLDFVSQKKDSNIVASSGNNTLTTQANWEAGALVNADTFTYLGNIVIDNIMSFLIPQSSYIINTSTNSEQANNVKDGSTETAWSANITDSTYQTVKVDLGANTLINKIRINAWVSNFDSLVWVGEHIGINYSVNDISYTDYTTCSVADGVGGIANGWNECNETTDNDGRYIEFSFSCTPPNCNGIPPSYDLSVKEIEIYIRGSATDTPSATHTSSPTQIGDVSSDPGRYVVEYNGFDTTETEPANTAIDYRFQLVNSSGVSTDGWTAWALGDVADLATTYPSQLTLSQTKIDAGETYLQVQSRLTTTDGVSTPTLSDYTASYHTNKAPNTPTPQ